MGSKTFNGVWFTCFSHDHSPPHVHAMSNGCEVLVELLPTGKTRQARRKDSVRPKNAKRSEVRRILNVAAAHAEDLMKLWEKARGSAS